MSPPAKKAAMTGKISKVLQLEVWAPGEPEMTLFSVYSPAHVFLWMATTSANWMLTLIVMGIVAAQVRISILVVPVVQEFTCFTSSCMS
jgi:hypothetical protein